MTRRAALSLALATPIVAFLACLSVAYALSASACDPALTRRLLLAVALALAATVAAGVAAWRAREAEVSAEGLPSGELAGAGDAFLRLLALAVAASGGFAIAALALPRVFLGCP